MSHPFRYRYKERHNNCWRKFPKSSGNLPPLLRASTLSEVRTDPVLSKESKDLNTLSSFLNLRVVDTRRRAVTCLRTELSQLVCDESSSQGKCADRRSGPRLQKSRTNPPS